MAEIDSLEIKISAEDNTASKKINSLAKALEKLDKALASGGMNTVVKSMEALNKSAGGLSTVEKAMKSVSDAANGIGKSVEAMKGVGALLQQFGKVGKIEVSKSLPKRLTEIGKAAQSISPDSLERLDAMTQSLSKLKGVGNLLQQLGKIGKIELSENLPKRLTEIGEAMRYISSDSLEKLYDMTQSLSSLKGVSLRGVRDVAKKLPKTKKEDAGALSDTPELPRTVKDGTRVSSWLSSVSAGAKKAIGYIKKFFSALSPLADKVLPKVGSGLKTLGKSIISHVTKPFKSAISVIGKWKNAFGRVAIYRVLRSAIAAVTEGFSTGIKNLYEYSRLAGTEFAPAMNTLSTNALYLKNSLGAMAAPLIQAVVPAVETVINAFVTLLNIIGKVFAALSGKSTYSQAKKYATEYGEALDGAAGAAKALKDYTLGFDELNVFNDNGSGGGGGGGSGLDYAFMFEEVTNPYADWAKSIRDAIANGDWLGAGALLAEKLNSLLDRFRWKDWGEKLGKTIQKALSFTLGFLRKFNWIRLGSKLAEFLNSAISNVRAKDIGALLASKIRVGVELAFGFFTTFDWTAFGTWLSDIVNGWFEEIDWATVGRAITSGIAGLLKTLAAFLKHTDWDEIGKSIGEVLKNIDWSEILSALWDAFTGAVGGVFELLGGFQSKLGGLSKVVFDIGIGFASWKVLSKMIPLLKKAVSNLKNIKKQAGITLAIVGFSVEWNGAFDSGRNGASLENVLKTALGSALGIVGSLMTFGTGPLGWSIGIGVSLIVGITGYVSGMQEAIKDIQKQAFRDALFATGGMPIEDLIGESVAQLDEILSGNNLQQIAEYGEGMKAADENIQSAKMSLDTYFTTLEVSGDKSIEKLEAIIDLMDELADATGEKMSLASEALETTLVVALNSASGEAKTTYESLLKMAYLLESNMNTQVADWKMQLSEAREELAALDETSETYAKDYDDIMNRMIELTLNISGISGSTSSEISNASDEMENLNSRFQGLDFSNVQLATEALELLTQTTKTAYETARSAYDATTASVEELFSYIDEDSETFRELANIAVQIDPSVDTSSLESVKGVMLGAIQEIYDSEVSQIDKTYTDTLSLILSSTSDALKQAAEESEAGHLYDQYVSWWIGNKDEYNRLSPEYKQNVDEMASNLWNEAITEAVGVISEDESTGKLLEAMESSLQDVESSRALTTGISGAIISGMTDGLTDPTAQALLSNGFDGLAELVNSNAEKVGLGAQDFLVSGILKDLDNMESGRLKPVFDIGKSVSEGFAKGITENSQTAFDAAGELGTGSANATRESVDSNSPSRVFEEIGKDMDLGLELGIREKFDLVTTTVKRKLTGLVQTAASYFESPVWADMARKASEALRNNLVMPELKPIELSVTFTTDVSAERKSIYQALGLRGWPKLQWKAYESGGFPKQGEIFIANERSAEMIGSIGNRTAVANNDQIVAGISDGVSEANRGVIDALLEVCGRLIEAIEENKTDVRIGDEDIYKANRRYEQRAGTNTTRGAFAYVR